MLMALKAIGWPVVLVDNSPEKLEYYDADWPEYIHCPSNVGIAEAQNMGIEALDRANMEAVLILDQDSQLSLPFLQNLYEKFDGKRVKWFLVDITEATRTSPGFEDSPKAGPFLAKKGITMPILNDNRGVAKERYGAKTLPRLYVIDKFQTIRLAKKGFHEGEDFEGEVGSMVEILLAEADE